MKKYIALSIVAATTMAFGSTASDLAAMKAEIAALKAEVATLKKGGDAAEIKKIKKTLSEVKAHDANDNIKWGVDLRTSFDNINYDMADGSSKGKDDLMATRLWLNMEYAADEKNIFKGQLSMNKAFGADFGTTTSSMPRGYGMDSFDWVTNEALAGDTLKVREAAWLYLGDSAFGADIPWTFSVGRRPSTNGFLANLREDDEAQSPLGHVINVEFDGLSSKLDLSNVTGVPGMSIKLCTGQGSTNAEPLFATATSYANDDEALKDITLYGFIFEPYNDSQYIVKTIWYKGMDLPGYTNDDMALMMDGDDTTNPGMMTKVGDLQGAALSVLVDGLTDDGFLSETKVFGSLAWSQTDPFGDELMLGSNEQKSGSSYWLGAQFPVLEGQLGLEYNHGSKYWRPFTYGEDTMIGSKLAARGDAYEAYYTYQLTEALSAQLRFTSIDYDYTGSNSFFGVDGTPMSISDIKANAAWGETYLAANPITDPATMTDLQKQAAGAIGMEQNTVESAQDFRFYLRYRF
ncbi:MAG: DUF3373 domain-containing protein [Sulfurovum sp.]|jgi:hypothetical protein|nr:DUF3373 domain-containing protein [Sulfurovum sp.]